ncbi:MAG: antirestriction protein ArdA [Oscillospiraceae bacterium]|nr:antirestriction protein ArdA [Oscillospiraceae bacterium]
MQFQAVLFNRQHPEYGVATIPFPIEGENYAAIMELLEPMEIGNAVQRDCRIEEIRGGLSVLKQMEMTEANLDELDYLAKRLDSFDKYELTQFQSAASRLNLHGVDEMINLTFCCQEVTVITDFSDLDGIGRRHFLTMNGGATTEAMSEIDGAEIAHDLICAKAGHVTLYGVVYDNDMELRQIYDGQHFPEYRHKDCVMEVEMYSRYTPQSSPATYLYLPMPQAQIERAMLRANINNYGDMCLRFMESELPEEIDAALDMDHENLTALNEMCEAISQLSPADRTKLAAAVSLAKPEYSSQIKELAEQLDLFDFVPDAHTPEDYGRYMITESGHYEFDENLAEYYEFAKYGQQRMEQEYGEFNARGYIAYHGTLSLDEIMFGSQGERMEQSIGEMGGMA